MSALSNRKREKAQSNYFYGHCFNKRKINYLLINYYGESLIIMENDKISLNPGSPEEKQRKSKTCRQDLKLSDINQGGQPFL